MKQLKLIMIFTFFGLILASCSKEFEEIENEVEIPETVELITANIEGVIYDINGELVDNITVDILVDGILLASTESTNGSYAFENQAAHQSKTILRAHSKTYAPNFSSISIPVENELVNHDFVVGLLTNKQEYNTSEAFVYQPSEEFTVSLVESSFTSEVSSVELVSTVFNFPENSEKLITNRVGINAAGDMISLSLSSVYYVGAFAALGDEALLKSDKEFTISIPASADESLWFYDTTLGSWKEIEAFSNENDQSPFSSNAFTYFASVSIACTDDIDPPIPYCVSSIALTFGEGDNIIWAQDVNVNSTDNCSTDLVFEIKKLNDVCANGSDAYGPTILFCDVEIGETIPVRMKVSDEAGNSDFCDVTIVISGASDCANDVEPPIPVCISSVPLLFDEGDNIIWAEDINFNSTDNCSTDLVFEIKKLNDLCGNGSDAYGPSILFCDMEIGETIPVRMKVSDEAGNSNYCDVNVIVSGASDCTNDVDPPIPYCINSLALTFGEGDNIIWAQDVNFNSTDNCSTDLVYEIKKLNDDCANGSDAYGPSIIFCDMEIGETVPVRMKVSDEAGNSDFCDVNIVVSGTSDCSGDVDPPIPYCIQGSTVVVANDFIEVDAVDFDAGSFDNCSQNLDFQIRKLTDICSNGSDQFDEKVTFCQAEVGSTIILRLLISDENNNSDSCDISVNVE